MSAEFVVSWASGDLPRSESFSNYEAAEAFALKKMKNHGLNPAQIEIYKPWVRIERVETTMLLNLTAHKPL